MALDETSRPGAAGGAVVKSGALPLDRRAGRYDAIDGLRGGAAMAVVLFHLYDSAIRPGLDHFLPSAVTFIMRQGYLGVPVFFVISGFVITLSWGNKPARGPDLAVFFARRHIRLDPPYWIAVGLAYLDLAVPHLVHRGQTGMVPVPRAAVVLAHIAYVQDILRMPELVPVFWTLCIEVQFYVVFAVSRATSRGLTAASGSGWRGRGVDAVLACGSLACAMIGVRSYGTFIPYWYQFVFGSWVCWVVKGEAKEAGLLVAAAVLLASSVWLRRADLLVVTAATVTILMVSKYDWGGLLSSKPMSYLGKISYSLYLTHYTIGSRIINFGWRVTGPDSIYSLTWLCIGVVGSVAFAHLFFVVVEQPFVTLGRNLRQRPGFVLRRG